MVTANRSASLRLGLGLLLLGGLAGCRGILGAEKAQLDQTDGGTDPDASLDASVEASDQDTGEGQDAAPDTAPAACTPSSCSPPGTDGGLAKPPCRPTTADSASLPETFVYALRSVRLGMDGNNADDWKDLGYDQDCLFTPASGQPSMCKPSGSRTDVQEDGNQGRDNSFGRNIGGAIRLAQAFGIKGLNVEPQVGERLEAGQNGLLVSISDYNGTPNDPQVTVGVYQSMGTVEPPPEDAGTVPSGSAHVYPKWDGSDYWSVYANSITADRRPVYADDLAYVSDGYVVAHMPNGISLPLNIHSRVVLSIEVDSAMFTAKLSEDKMQLTEGQLSGLQLNSRALSMFEQTAGQLGLCPGEPPEYSQMQAMIRESADIRADLVPQPEVECNAMSMGIGFTAYRANLGITTDPAQDKPRRCGFYCDDLNLNNVAPTTMHTVSVTPPGGGTPISYQIDSTEVTQAQYCLWLKSNPTVSGPGSCAFNATYTPNPSCMKDAQVCWGPGCERYPQPCIDWCDAYSYCKAQGKRLCGQIGQQAASAFDSYVDAQVSQWYNACSSGGVNPYPYGTTVDSRACNGGSNPDTGCASVERTGTCTSVAVGLLPRCQSTDPAYQGIFDMAGNLSEWEDSCMQETGPDDNCHVRGGSVQAAVENACTFNDYKRRVDATEYVGFRCCSDP